MINKDTFCKAFCEEIEVRKVPAGFAVKTPFAYADGDFVGFYVVECGDGYRFEDSGTLIPWLESTGVNLQAGARLEQLQSLLLEHQATLDEDEQEVRTDIVQPDELPAASVRFVSLLLRLQDLQMMRPEVVEKTFVEDVKKAVYGRYGTWASVLFDTSPIEGENDYTADIFVKPPSGESLALYLGTRDARVDEAVMAWMESQIHKESSPFKVAVMYEDDKLPPTVSRRSYRRATNRVDGTLFYRGDESGAIARIGRMLDAPANTSPITTH